MLNKKRILAVLMAATMMAGMSACGNSNEGTESKAAAESTGAPASEAGTEGDTGDFDYASEVTVVSREDGSGTRGAFIELFGIEEKDDKGEKVDHTTLEAEITNSTSVMMTSIAGDEYGIGYISLGSLNDTVKALKIDGAEATADNIKSGTYKVSRPFNIATGKTVSEVAQDFINFIMSTEGQEVVAGEGYISLDDVKAFEGKKTEGKIVIAGSSSVTPVMEALSEAYKQINTGATIEIQQSDSTTGMTSAIDGVCDIGMASRELKDSELEAGLTPYVIATDGIAVIVNNANPVDELSSEDVKAIFTGEKTDWQQ